MARPALFGVHRGQARRRSGLAGTGRGGQGVLLESRDADRWQGYRYDS